MADAAHGTRRQPQHVPQGAARDANVHPPTSMLFDLLTDVEKTRPWRARARFDALQDCYPPPAAFAPLTPCCELLLGENEELDWVLSQKRSGGKLYITTTGKAGPKPGSGMKRTFMNDGWPRVRAKDGRRRRRQICLHRWMCIAVHGPPSRDDFEAAHRCGNDACIAPDHVQWASQSANRKDRSFHANHLPVMTDAGLRRFARPLSPVRDDFDMGLSLE